MPTISSSTFRRFNPRPTALQEFRVLTNTFDAEYGRNSGSVVNVVTKSGTNDLHGSVYEFFRNKVLNANKYCLTAAEGLPCEKPQFNQNQFGGTFGGPIKRDRTFFFATYEGDASVKASIAGGDRAQLAGTPIANQHGEWADCFGFLRCESGGDVYRRVGQLALLTSSPGCQAATTALGGGIIQDGAPYGATRARNPLAPFSPTARFPSLAWTRPRLICCSLFPLRQTAVI